MVSDASASPGSLHKVMTDAAIAIACDHAGLVLKAELVSVLNEDGHAVLDLGTDGPASVDYPDFADASSTRSS
jgi:ribose 5-phosphate isomerase B